MDGGFVKIENGADEAIIIQRIIKYSRSDAKIMETKFILEKLSPLELPPDESLAIEKRIIEADFESRGSGFGWAPPKFPEPTPQPSYERIKCQDYIFVFKYDENKPDILHIYSRHLTTSDDAIALFFSYDPVWDGARKRYANYSDTHGLYWFWCNQEKKVVMVISCFRRPPERPVRGRLA